MGSLIWLSFATTICQFADAQSGETLPALRTVAEVRQLSAFEANKGYPVILEGIITYCSYRAKDFCFLQDETGGIFIDDPPVNVPAGSFVRIEGSTKEGWFATDVAEGAHLTLIGQRVLPEPSSRPVLYFLAGREDSHVIEIESVVQSALRYSQELRANRVFSARKACI
jgi:hypothetical protein